MNPMRIADPLLRRSLYAGLIIGLLLSTGWLLAAREAHPATTKPICAHDNGGITLPAGFCATVFADNIGHARHLAVAPNGVVYVNTWSGRYYGNDTPPAGGFLVGLLDSKGEGRADVIVRFGDSVQTGSAGGTGVTLHGGALFAEVDDRIVRYALPGTGIVPTEAPTVIVSGLPLTGDHPMHPFAIDARGALYVNSGSATNACQVQNRMPRSPGHQPCTELETRGGIWRYEAERTGQRFSPAERFITGLRNAGGIAIDSTGVGIYATQHGRDQLAENWPALYKPEQGANLPAEELVRVERGADYGWPECYYDDAQQKLVLAPEYGGDGGQAVGALYVADDAHGRIWRIIYTGAVAATRGASASARSERADAPAAAPAERVGPPEGIHADAGAHAAGLPTPKGATAEMVALGDRLYHANTCVGCHGSNAEGTPLGSDLTKGKWLWGDGSLAAIARTITQGVPNPKEHTGVMPPMGGAQLSPSDVSALAAYLAALNQRTER